MSFPNPITANTNLIAGGIEFAGQFNGAFPDGSTDRYYPLYDSSAHKLRMTFTSDNEVTWSELDAAHAPSVAHDATGVWPKVWEYCNSCFDPVGRVIYSVYFNSSFKVSVIPFDIATKLFLAPIAASFGMIDTTDDYTYMGANEFGISWRPTDHAVLVSYAAGAQNPTDQSSIFWAKCRVLAAGWDAALSVIAGNAPVIGGFTGDQYRWGVNGMCSQTNGLSHVFYQRFPARGSGNSLWRRSILADDSLGTPEQIDTGLLDTISTPTISASNVIGVTYYKSSALKVARGTPGTWEITTPTGSHTGWASIIRSGTGSTFSLAFGYGAGPYGMAAFENAMPIDNVDYVFYTSQAGTIISYSYITSSGVGVAWSTPTVIGTVDQSVIFSANSIVATLVDVSAVVIVTSGVVSYARLKVPFGLSYTT